MNDFRRAIRARESAEVLLTLVTVSHDDFQFTIRRVDNTEDVISQGNTFVARPTVVVLPRESDRSVRLGSVTLDDTDLEVSGQLRRVSTPPRVLIDIVRATEPNTIEKSFRHLECSGFSGAGTEAVLQIGLADYRREPFPGGSFNPETFPNLF